jgi:tetratricopeptide (TPR) repeat protein
MIDGDRSCFVIMPIGKEGSEEHAHFRSVFEVIIKPSVEEAGFRVWRADESAFTGSMTREIVEALASSELVIADLTDRNPNVYLELGIRHCLRRSGTIHLISADQALPFDVAGYRAIKYSTDFDKIDGVRTALVTAIGEKTRNPEAPDNPVHDTLELPQDYRAIAESEQLEQLEASRGRLAEVTRELENLRRRYEGEDSPARSDREEPVFFDERELAARLSNISTQIREDSLPGQLMVRAQRAAAEGDYTEFLTVVQKLVLNPFIDGSDYRTLAIMSDRAGLVELKLLILEQGAAKFHWDSASLRYFAESCIHTSDPTIQQRGKRLLEGHLGVRWEGDTPKFTLGAIPDSDAAVAVLLDYYYSTDRSLEGLALALAALEVYGETPVILRNVARAYEDEGEVEQANVFYSKAIAADPNSDTSLAWFGNFNARQKNWSKARDLLVRACEADPDDPNLIISLLGVCVSEAVDAGISRSPTEVAKARSLGALAIARGQGSAGIRSRCAQRIDNHELAQLCLDPKWPTESEVEKAQANLAGLANADQLPAA